MASSSPIKALALASICLLQTTSSRPAGAASVCPDGAFCDDFEDDRLGAPPGGPWTSEIFGEPTIAVNRGEAFSGERSVRIEAKGKETAFIALKGAPLFPMASNALHGRAMIKLESAPDKRVHWTIIEGKGLSPEGGHVVEFRYGGAKPIEKDGVFQGSRLMANYETPEGPKTDCWRAGHSRTVMPTGRWICVAWAFYGQSDGMKLWLDGALQEDLTVDGVGQGCMHATDDYRWRAPLFDQINLGWETYKEDGKRTIWIDDVVIGNQPIACPDQ